MCVRTSLHVYENIPVVHDAGENGEETVGTVLVRILHRLIQNTTQPQTDTTHACMHADYEREQDNLYECGSRFWQIPDEQPGQIRSSAQGKCQGMVAPIPERQNYVLNTNRRQT